MKTIIKILTRICIFIISILQIQAQTNVALNNPNIKYDGTWYSDIQSTKVVFNRILPAAYNNPESGYYGSWIYQWVKCESGIRIRFKTDSPIINLTFAKGSGGHVIDPMPKGFNVFANGNEIMATANLAFTITNPTPGTLVTFEVTLPNVYDVDFTGFSLTNGYSLSDPWVLNEPVYVAIGNSISQGTGQYCETSKTWPFLFAKSLGWDLYNIAVAGAGIGWATALNIQGKTVNNITIELGYNDWFYSSNTLAIESAMYGRLIDSLRKYQPQAKIYCIAPLTTMTTTGNLAPYTLAQLRTEICSLVSNRTLAGDKLLYCIDGSSISNASMLTTDGVHLSESGAQTFAANMTPLVDNTPLSGILLTATSTPTSMSNNGASIKFIASASATAPYTIKNLMLNLTTLGGDSAIAMTSLGNNQYGYTYNVAAGLSFGTKTIVIKASDNSSHIQTTALNIEVGSGIVFDSAKVTPSAVMNTTSNSLNFTVSATDDGWIANISLDLSSIGGGSSVFMNSTGGSNYSLNYTTPTGFTQGARTIIATATDNQGYKLSTNISLVIYGPVSYKAIYADASTMITGTWSSLTLVEQTTPSAEEGVKDYLFTFNSAANSYFAGFGLNLSNWTVPGINDFMSYDTLQIAYYGPISSTATGIQVQFTDGTPNTSICSTCTNLSGGPILPAVNKYTLVKIPMSAFNTGNSVNMDKVAELDISITGFGSAATSGTLRVDNIQLIKKKSLTTQVLNSYDAASYLYQVFPNPNNGSFSIQSKVESDFVIVNDMGQSIEKVSLNASNNYTYKADNLKAGIYIVVGDSNTTQSNFKVIVTK